jgi:hypothetical protein
MTTPPINLTQLRTIVESAKGADPGIGPREVLALIDTVEAAIAWFQPKDGTATPRTERLRETLNRYTTTP